ncbi:alpha/beta fold hydrolase [Glaciimonas sp. PCH181]|uniref:alpha/beta fold hydrolase n=1 Tax=Glaciimonas sp. PCH181 TaxID=2133943 RepID=UPI000D3A257E|nr:alpha/beta hydrolase [Glaciimonas sp. PCH181]PUA18750.1 alpha/beta hydrolase [Glaciimonas sp. PCH181]
MIKQIEAGVLNVAYTENGPIDGIPVMLLHGFPYDVHAYDEVTPLLVSAGCRVFTPYLRGYGATRFLSPDTPRSGQQAVLAQDLLTFMDALGIEKAVLAGYDWGGRAACIVSALWPERVIGLVTGGGYNLQDIPSSIKPQLPQNEHRYWYQYYFHSDRGEAGLMQNRGELCRLLWTLWSPNWQFDQATYQQTAAAFDNPDFVPVVIHSYRHRFGLVAGDPTVEHIEQLLTKQPIITVPTVTLEGGGDGVSAIGGAEQHGRYFSGPYQRQVIPLIGHNIPQEAPHDFAAAIFSVLQS